ncbi:hypothetical protein [Streptomyces sp. CA-111067]|uniref:hypothetical protein n=1 Tax=Streptomyces sp. CA-111067 TaxID=3240046 RepID=UPI003D97DB93
MDAESERVLFLAKVTEFLTAALPGATVMEMPSAVGEDAVSLAGYDEADVRPALDVVAALDGVLRADGWETVRSSDGETEGLNVAKEGVGGGVFGVRLSVISFTGIPGYGNPEPEPEPVPDSDAAPDGDARRTLSAEIRAAITSAMPGAVLTRDVFEADGSVRIAGSDPESGRPPGDEDWNQELLDKAGDHLAAHDWQVAPDMWNGASSDRTAWISKPGLADGRLDASGGLTFTGRVTPSR